MTEDTLPTLWPIEPHTQAKLSILKSYLQAWMPRISRRAASERAPVEVFYIDAFAGPGEYEGGESGSPKVAVEAAVDHEQALPVPVTMYFIERREDRFRHLDGVLKPFVTQKIRNAIVNAPIWGEAEVELRRILSTRSARQYRPTLVFLDQFGYAAIPMNLVADVLQGASCELLAFMNWRDLNRWLPDESKWVGIDRAFGGTEWRRILDLDPAVRSKECLALYEVALRARGGTTHTCTFSMHDRNGRLLYWLIFGTKSYDGLEEMKRSMWRVDTSGAFRFSDKHSEQLRLLKGFDQEWLAQLLSKELDGRELTVADIRRYVLSETPCHLYATALANLEKEGRLSVYGTPANRRRGAFKTYEGDPGVTVKFVSSSRALFDGL